MMITIAIAITVACLIVMAVAFLYFDYLDYLFFGMTIINPICCGIIFTAWLRWFLI
jgi:hypothetical protein